MSTFVILFLNLIPAILKGIPGISAALQQVIADITSSTAAILGSGVVTQPSVNTILAAWLGVINALKADPNIPPTALTSIAQLEKAVQAAIANDAQAALQVDWSQTHQIASVQ